MKTRKQTNSSGFTIIELLLVIVLVLTLAFIVAASYNSIRKRERNKERRNDITIIQNKLEIYYAKHNKYPTLDQLNNDDWREANIKDIENGVLSDPLDTNSKFVNKPTENVYAYQVTGTDGEACNDDAVLCTQYTLTSTYEGGGTFAKNNIN